MDRPSLLIIDDDDAARQQLTIILSQSPYAGLGIQQASTLDGGLRLMKEDHPLAVFLDPSIQDGSDDAVRHAIRISPKSFLVIVTQLKMFEVAHLAINAGCRGYLLKPVMRNEVIDLMERLIGDGRDGTGAVDFGDPIKSAVRYLETHFANTVTLADMAQRVYLSPSYFSRQFKLEMQVTFVEFLTQLRIKHAKKLLRMTELPIDMIAEESGFHRASYFTTLFRRVQGLSPSEYRHQFRDRLTGNQ